MRKPALAFIYAVFIFLYPAALFAEEAITVKAEGAALKSDNTGEVKRKAIDRALKSAVEEALKLIVKEERIDASPEDINRELLASPRTFILNYRVLSEGWVSHLGPLPPIVEDLPQDAQQSLSGVELYHIWMEASVDGPALRGALGRLAVAKGATAFTINILDVTDYAAFEGVVNSLKRIAILKDISYTSFYRGRAVVVTKAAADENTLVERISKEVPEGFAVIPGGPSLIIIKKASQR